MDMTTRKLLYSALAGISLTPAAAREKPDIILIMTDQHRGDALGCTSGGVVITPNIDSLAASGYLFTSAYSSTPSSTPARAGLLTGCSPWRHGMLGYGNQAWEGLILQVMVVVYILCPEGSLNTGVIGQLV